MEGYPTGSLDHNVPFLVASGLNVAANELPLDAELRDQGILLRSDLPPLETREAGVLEQHFRDIDSHGRSWRGVERDELYRFRIKAVGRSFLLPPRCARLPEGFESVEASPTLHSPFSPLSPVSAIYPDGLIDAQWVKKHQELVPSIFLCLYSLTNDPTSTTLHDNHLKADINTLKAALARSGYKTRLAVLLLGDSDAPPVITDAIAERLENIRKGTALDPKSIFYIPPQESPAELKRVFNNILGVLYTTSIEYYRDLGRHARKKRSRGYAPQPTVPPTSGTSQTLSLQGWNFRYDLKSAVFAEFRQEIDAALRSFEQAYEVLLGPDVLDITPSWSPRWNEARLLSDVIAIRCLRCHLWMAQSTLAVRRWQAHRDRIGDFVERRGRGTNNYGWQAWEARWAMVMANLVEKLDIPTLAPPTMNLFIQPEKAVMGERLQPWELLHHTGYWYRIAARHLAARRRMAHLIPEEDRSPPDAAPASQLASKAYAYDTYMCPEPYHEYPLSGEGVNHSQLIIDCLITASSQFQGRKQLRMAAELALECAREMINLESWQEAVAILRPLWEDMSFRSEGWAGISEELCWLVRQAALGSGRADLVVAADWELMNKKFIRRPQWHYDLSKSLEKMTLESKPSISISDDTTCSFVSASVVFRNKEGKAGETTIAQLALISNAFADAAPVAFKSLKVEFGGNLKPIFLEHAPLPEDQITSKVAITDLHLEEDFSGSEDDLPMLLKGESDLTLRPGQIRVFTMVIPLREPGDASASALTFSYANETFDLNYTLNFKETDRVTGWFVPGSSKPRHARPNAHTIHIQPRPPKMEIKLIDPLVQYYANEPIELKVELLNAEDEPANVKLDVHVFGKEVPALRVKAKDDEQISDAATEEAKILGINLGAIEKSSTIELLLSIDPAPAPTTLDLHIKASYHLASDGATPIAQMLPVQLNVVNAFEANYDLVPRLHPDPWPSLFDYEGLQNLGAEGEDAVVHANGFAQKWCLLCHFASFAHEDLKVMGMEMKVVSCVGGARCNVVKGPDVPQEGISMGPKTMHEAQFDLVAQKLSLDDRHPVTLELAFVIKWKRQSNSSPDDDYKINTTTMPVGKYLVLGTEPRVLASVYHGSPDDDDTGLIHLDTTIENPSNHFLTFGLSMEPSDEFAFSGPKQTTINLLPMSRRTMIYRLLPLVRGAYIRPALTVRDKYFQKVLRIIPTEGMKIDKDGLLVWVAGDEKDEGESEQSESEEKTT